MSSRFTGLWQHPDFMKLWIGQTISEFGSRITREGLPLTAILVLGVSADQVGLLVALSALPILIFSLIAGAWVDRLRRRPVMIVADALRFGLLLLIPVAALTNTLSFGLIVLVATLHSAFTMLFRIAYHAYLPALLTDQELLEGNTKLATSESLAEIGGPPLAGVLIQWLGAPFAIFFDALSFLGSVISLSAIRTVESTPESKRETTNLWGEILTGIQFIRRTPLLMVLAVSKTARQFFGNFYAVLYSLFALRVLGLSPGQLGFVIAFGGIGSLCGALFTQGLTRRFGLIRTIALMLGIGATVGWLTPFAGGAVWQAMGMLIIAQLVNDAAISVAGIAEISLRQMITPDMMLGRVNATLEFLQTGIAPLGALVGGLLATWCGVRETLLIAVIGGVSISLSTAVVLLRIGKTKRTIE
jgi:predicted MFS family arabinose efflux permease